MRTLQRGLIAVVVGLFATALAAQDFPAEPASGSARETPPPASLSILPEGETLPPLLTPLPILDRLIVPGSKLQLDWRPDGGIGTGEIPSPVVVVHGAKPGPVLCLVAGIHGDEINGVEIVRRVVHGLDPTRLAGTVIGTPIVNVFGYSRGVRYLPDRRDLNRHFPGSPRGSIAARIAHGFMRDIVRHCDFLVDFHTGSFDRDNLPQLRADLADGAVLEFTRAFGNTLVLHSPGSKGMLRTSATGIGIPAVTFEVGAPARLQLPEIASAVAAIDAVMHRLGIRATGQTEEGMAPPPTYFDSRWVRAPVGGLLIGEVSLGQSVQQGQRLGRIIDPVHNAERAVLAPHPGRVLGLAQNQQVMPGFATFHLGIETSEQQAVEHAESGEDSSGDDAVPEDSAERPDPGAEEGDG